MLPSSWPLKAHERHDHVMGPVGRLEVIYGHVDHPRGLALICHPDPCEQGTMHNKVVTTLCRRFEAAGYVSVRFNYRGVGESEGSYGHRFGEVADAIAVLQDARQRYPDCADRLWLAGFSFGAYIAAYLAQAFDVCGLMSVAPSVKTADYSALGDPGCPWSILQCRDDEVVSPQAVMAWSASHQPAPTLTWVQGCGHFFHGKLKVLADWADGALQPNDGQSHA